MAARIIAAEKKALFDPSLAQGQHAEPSLFRVLQEGRKVHPYRLSQILAVSFRHSDPQLAAQVADWFVHELATLQRRREVEIARARLESLVKQFSTQREKTEALAESLAQRRSTFTSNEDPSLEPLIRDLELEEAALARLLTEVRSESMTAPSSLLGHLTPATPPAPGDYISPNHLLHLGLGSLLGLLGAFLTARLRLLA